MEKKLPTFQVLSQFLICCFSLSNEHFENVSLKKIKLSLLFFFFCFSLWAQPPHTLTSNGTIVVPAGVTVMDVQAWGGGGAGGGAGGSGLIEGRSGGGGGGGAYARSNITVVASNTLNVVVAGTTAGTTTNGTAGGHSTITGFEGVIYAAGGAGGLGNNAGGAPAGGAGGSTAASFGTTKAAGEAGGVGGNVLAALLLSSGKGGNGASPGGGLGGASVPSLVLGTAVGNPGVAPGGGGSGSMSSALAAAQPGGAGAHGQVIVTYTCPTYSITGISAVNVCSNLGTTSLVTLTSSAASLPTGTYTVTYSRSNPNATGLTAIMTVTSAGTGTFTATGLNTVGTSNITVTNLTSGVCSSPISTSNVTTVTIFAPSAGGTVTGGTTICAGATSAALSLGGQTGTVQKWQYSVNPFSTWNDIANTTATYTSGALTETTQFRAVVQNGVCTAANSVATTVTVNPLPQGTLTANGPFCVTGNGQLTFTATAGTGPYTIVYKENGGADRTAAGVVSGTPFATFTTPVTATTTYTLVSVTGANTCSRNSGFTGGSATITINPLPQGSLTANGPFCVTGTGELTFTATAGTGPYTVVYKENGGADRTAAGVVSGTPFATFTTPVTATTTYTLVSVTGANTCVRNTGFTGGSATITINPLPQGSLTANGPFCATGAGLLTFTATAGTGPYTVVYKENGGADRTAAGVVSGTPFATFTTPVTATTTYTLVSVTGANTCVRNTGFTGGSATITINPLPQGSLTANGPFCATGAGLLTFTATAGTGPYTVVYKENGGADRTASGVVSGTPFATFTTPVTASTTYTLVSVTGANTCSRNSGFTGVSAVITINPIPVPTFTTQPAASVCVNTDVTYTTQTGESSYLWNVPGVLNTDYIITSGGISSASNSVTLQWLTTGSKTVTVGYSSIGCASNTSASNTTTVTKTERGAVHGGNHICAGDPSPLLTLTDYTGTIVRWEYAESIPYVWQPFANTSNTYQPGVLTTSTSYRAVVKNGTCPEEFAIETRIDVEPKPSTPVLAIITQPTCVNPTGSVHLSGLLATPNWTITQNGTVFQTYTSSGTSYTITNLAPGNYTFTIHDINICPSLPTINLEIKAPITNIWNGTSWSKGSPPIVTDAVRFSGNYSTTGDLSGCSCVVDAGANVTVNSNHTLTITNSVTNNGGLLTFENNASLMQVNNVVNTGNIVYKRNTTPVRRYDFTYWSSPIVRTPAYTLHDLSPNTLADKYYSYNPTTGWVISYNGALEMIPGHGYIIRAPQNFDINSPSVYGSFLEGVPNNGTITVSLAAAEKSHLLGNPYPSAIYADQFIFDNTANLYGTLYFWTHNSLPSNAVPGDAQYNYSSSDYAIYNLTGSIVVGNMSGQGAGTPGNQSAPLGYIAAGQAFFVKSKTALNAVFTNGMRVPGNNSQFFKTSDNNKEAIEKHRVWINLTNTQGAFKQLLIGYIEGATNTWDNNYDGVTIDGNIYLDFYSINEGRKLTVQGRALPFTNSDIVPLGYKSNIQGEFSIAIDHSDGDLTNHPIYLEDKWTNTTHNLQEGKYTFSTSTGTFLDRFVLKYAAVNLGVDDFENKENNLFVSVKNKNIKVNSTHDFIKEVSIFDISGKLIYNNKKIENAELQIPNLQSGNQVLIVKVTLENGKTATRKITFH